MSIIKDLPELIKEGVISQDTADSINKYYLAKGGKSQNKLLTVFAVLGAILVGLGIILIIAHNWDELSRPVKLFFAFVPLVTGQLLCGYTLLKKKDDSAWRESTATFLFFGVGTVISLVSQIYNISGDLNSFILTWMLLCLPLLYAMRSSVTSLLYIIGITWYAVNAGYFTYPHHEPYYYWLLLLLMLPHYYFLCKEKPESNFVIFHNWFVALSITIALGTVAKANDELMFIAYISLFGLFYIIGNTGFFKNQNRLGNAYLSLGSVGTVYILLFLSFDFTWERLRSNNISFVKMAASPEFVACVLTSITAFICLYLLKRNKTLKDTRLIEFIFLIFIPCFMIGTVYRGAAVLINILVLAVGISAIRKGAKEDHLGILNYGLLIIAALVTCRFFDTDLSFIARGILFVLVGLGFFFANYQTIKKRKENV